MQVPPDDSIFSLPIWRSSAGDPRSRKIQMNPVSAYQRGFNAKAQSLAVSMGMVIVLLVVFAGGLVSVKNRQTVNVQASFDMKRSLTGTVAKVFTEENSFSVVFESSPDQTIRMARKASWTIQLPPGVSFTRPSFNNIDVCFSVSDIRERLSAALPGTCSGLIQPGMKALIEYVVVNAPASSIIAKTIIVEILK